MKNILFYGFIVYIICNGFVSVHGHFEVVPNKSSIQYSFTDNNFLSMITECDIVKNEMGRSVYPYYDELYHDRFDNVKSGGQLVIAIDTVCAYDWGMQNKTILVDYFSNEFSYARVNTHELTKIDGMS